MHVYSMSTLQMYSFLCIVWTQGILYKGFCQGALALCTPPRITGVNLPCNSLHISIARLMQLCGCAQGP